MIQTLGKYQLGELLGQGGMGAVYRSFHPQLSRPVAVKVILGGAADPQIRQRFLREAQVVAGLSHPNIINIFDVDVQDGHTYRYKTILRQLRWIDGRAAKRRRVIVTRL